jgi:putative DNA primase/helicase
MGSETAGSVEQSKGREKPTDVGNARRLVERHGARLRFVPDLGAWLTWGDGRWVRDECGRVMELAKETVRNLFHRASNLADDEERIRLAEHARHSERRERLNAMIDLARTDERVVVRAVDLDSDPWSFNCLNGTIDLRTGELRPHLPADLISKQAPVVFERGAACERFQRFLSRVTGGDHELATFVQSVIGLALIGGNPEEIIMLFYGPGGSGKTTLLEAVKAALGPYAATADTETFLRQSQPRGARNDLARLLGARLVVGSEIPPGRHLDEATVKAITGRGTITARFLYMEAFEFLPQFTLCLESNHLPMVRDDDTGMWRRLRVMPFAHAIPAEEQDPTLKDYLRDPTQAGPAVLAWAVEGCLRYQREGLEVPAAVTQATDNYRSAVSTFSQFLEDCCIEGQDHWVSNADLSDAWTGWSAREGQRYPIGQVRIAGILRQRGHVPEKRRGQRGWRGLVLLPTDTIVDRADSSDTGFGKSA